MSLKQTFILIGPPGSGKGTQAELLADSLRAVHLSSGQVLRDHASLAVKSEMERGELVREKEVDIILESSLKSASEDAIWILDGYIRLAQDKAWLEASLARVGRSIDMVIIIDVSESLCRERVMSRGRADDTAEAWTERWAEFETITMPVIKSLERLPHIHIDGSGDTQTINDQIISALGKQVVIS